MGTQTSQTDDYVASTRRNYAGRHEAFAAWAEQQTNVIPAARCRYLLAKFLSKSLTQHASDVTRNLTILDAGCGPGRDLAAFTHDQVTFQIGSTKRSLCIEGEGFDCCEDFVDKCVECGLNAVVGDFIGYFATIPHDKKFDAIFSLAALFHLPETELVKVLAAFHMHLHPHGIVLTSIPEGVRDEKGRDGRWMLSLSETQQKALLENAGFDVVHCEKMIIYNGNWLVLVARKK